MSELDNSRLAQYNAEAQERWGKTGAYREYAEKSKGYSGGKWDALAGEMDGIMAEFALCVKAGQAPGAQGAQGLVMRLQSHITENYYLCTQEILAGLGQMYVLDERFRNHIDRHADGTAAFICEAIGIYCG